MEGMIPTHRMCIYENEFQKGVIYTIENFYDSTARKKYRAVEHPFWLSFAQQTLI